MLKKSRAIKVHAKKRFVERFNQELDKKCHDKLVKQIQKEEGEFLGKKSLARTVWLIDGMVLVYDKKRKLIVTGMRNRKAVK